MPSTAIPFDFEAAVSAPFRMQPGLRRLAPGSRQLTPLAPGSRHQREKLAVLSAFWPQALCAEAGFDAEPALAALCSHAADEHPAAWAWDETQARALQLGTAVQAASGQVEQLAQGSFGLGDEIARCLHGLPARWRLAALLSLAFAEDLALLDSDSGHVRWLAVALPSHWAPEDKVGRHFSEIHAPVADNALLLKAADSLVRLVGRPERWERFVWTVTDNPRLHAHPAHGAHTANLAHAGPAGVDVPRWQGTAVADAWFRGERQTFIPLPALGQAVFTIAVDVQPLAEVLAAAPRRAAALHAAVASMSPAVLAYRGLTPVRAPLLAWLAAQADAPASPSSTAAPGQA